MIKGRMLRSPRRLIMAMTVATCVFFSIISLPVNGFGQWQVVQKPTDYPSTVDPYEVIVYEHYNFVGEYMRFKLGSGMRQLLVSMLPERMNDRISSIQLGSKVGVFLFMDANFIRGASSDIFVSSQKELKGIHNDVVSSLIVFPKEWGAPAGVMLIDLGGGLTHFNNQFFPLPENPNETDAKHSKLPHMNDDANQIRIYPYKESPAYGKVRITLYEHPDFKGRWITLPGADGSIPPDGSFRMNAYQFDDTASSLIVRWTGPPPLLQVQVSVQPIQAPSTSSHVTAPPAPDTKQNPDDRTPPPPGPETKKAPSDKIEPLTAAQKAISTDISGQWNSNIGVAYEIQQTGDQFTWTVASLNQSGTGTISGTRITMSGPGWTVKGTITETDASGKPAKIVGENGVILFRGAAGPTVPATPPAQSPIPSTPLVPPVAADSLTGQWNSNIGVVYEIQQSGNQLTWTVPSLNQSGTGTITGNVITLNGPGWTVKGAVIDADASGKATKIVGENGVVLFR